MKKTTKQKIKLSPKDASVILRLEYKTENSVDGLNFVFEPILPNQSMFTLRKEIKNGRNKLDN